MSFSFSPTAVAPAVAKPKKTVWPEALKVYVGRAFENCSDADRPSLEEHLKNMITNAFESGSVWTTDWSTETLPLLGKRKSRFDMKSLDDTEEQRLKRLRRFEDLALKPSPTPPPAPVFSEGVLDFDEYTIVGHATKLEKSYLRLTSAPDPATVRPLHILKDTLELLKRKWKEESNYAYICDQFKSLRQDLTVQRIKNEFTIKVYEIHARIALEKGDVGEYNQCQTQLQTLYPLIALGNPLEFLAYRILYMLHTRNLSEVNTLLVSLTPAQRKDEAVAHALHVRKAIACRNYIRLFKLYLDAPNMSGYLMDQFIDRERIGALATICKAYRPRYTVNESSATLLGFGSTDELLDLLTTIGIQMSGNILETKEAFDILEQRRQGMMSVDIKGQM